MTEETQPLRTHQVTLMGSGMYAGRLRLRPLTEDDWGLLDRWNNDAEVLYYSEQDYVTTRTIEDTKSIYRSVSQTAFCFIMELDSAPIGECWLQKMNIDYILSKYGGLDCRRIDLLIGEKRHWNQGIGTEVIATLVRFGFEKEASDRIFAIVGSYNKRSERAFQKAGLHRTGEKKLPVGGKADADIEMSISISEYHTSCATRHGIESAQ